MSDQKAEILRLVGTARATPGENIALIGVTTDRARHNLWRVILDRYDGRWAQDGRIESVDTLGMLIRFTNGSRLHCVGLNQPEKLHAQRFTAVCLDASSTETEHALMMKLAAIMMPERADAPPPKPVFGL